MLFRQHVDSNVREEIAKARSPSQLLDFKCAHAACALLVPGHQQ